MTGDPTPTGSDCLSASTLVGHVLCARESTGLSHQHSILTATPYRGRHCPPFIDEAAET